MKSPLNRIIGRFLKPYRLQVVIIVLLQFAATIASLYLPRLNAEIINNGVQHGDIPYIWRRGGVMLAVTLGQIACQAVAVYFGAKTAMKFGRDVRLAVFDHALSFSSQELNHFGAPSMITRNTNDVTQVQMVVMMTFIMIISAPMTMIGGVYMVVTTNAKMWWLIAAAVLALAVIAAVLLVKMMPLFKLMQPRLDAINRVLREHIGGIRVVRAFVREPTEAQRFAQANAELMDVGLKVGRLMMTLMPLVMMVLNLSMVGVYWFGGHQIDAGNMQVGDLLAFMSYLMQILISVMMATMMVVMLPRAAVCAKRLMEVLDTSPSILAPERPLSIDPASGAPLLRFRGVAFRYPGAEASLLEDIGFDLLQGQTTAIIGSTGSGKTTLVNLIPRLFDVTDGVIELHGVDIRQLDPEEVWRRLALIPQKAYLFSGTVASNLRYGKPEASDEELWRALEIAQARAFVEEMEGQLEAPISQGGTNVSGGQRQRLAIARALVKQPEAYVFDDSFSALDLATDARLREALRHETGGAAVLIVAQRVSTIRQADQILVLDNGAIVGRGRHEELIESCPTYKEIVESQLSVEEVAA